MNMPYKDVEIRREYFRQYDAARPGRGRVANMTAEQIERQRERDRKRRNEERNLRRQQNGGQGYQSKSWLGKLKREFGLTAEQFEQMLKMQGYRCAACNNKFAGFSGSRSDRLAIDHCHLTGEVRGFLCGACNRTIGHAQDSSRRLRACADYLERFLT